MILLFHHFFWEQTRVLPEKVAPPLESGGGRVGGRKKRQKPEPIAARRRTIKDPHLTLAPDPVVVAGGVPSSPVVAAVAAPEPPIHAPTITPRVRIEVDLARWPVPAAEPLGVLWSPAVEADVAAQMEELDDEDAITALLLLVR